LSDGWAVVGTLFAGVVVWGGIGWLIDLWLDTTFVKAIGVLVGLVAGIYLVFVKYGNT
jgi:F0F1-type ATP synthase assembly protein I